MRQPRALPLLPVAAAAAGGVLLGHWLSYLATFQGPVRSQTLAATGHGYWSFALKALVALASAGIGALFLSHLGTRAGARPRPAPFTTLMLRLGLLQCLAFLSMETTERVAAHVPIVDVLQSHVLVLGLAFQILTACFGALLLLWLDRTAAGLVRLLARNARPPRRSQPQWAPETPFLPRLVLAGAAGVRGPPVR